MPSTAIPAASLPTHDQIARRAYDIYAVRHGSQPGHCQENWLQAERELLNESIAKHNQPSGSDTIEMDDDAQDDSNGMGSSHLHLAYPTTEGTQ